MTRLEQIALRKVNLGIDGINFFEACSTLWGKLNVASSVNLLCPDERELNDAIETCWRDGFDNVIIYRNHPENKGE